MEKVFICYKTDGWHSYASRDLIGVATTHEMALVICRAQAAKEHETIDESQIFNLKNISQTQGYSGAGEFVIEPVSTDTLL